jgi:hypothetical protein
MVQAMPRFQAQQVCPAADLNALAEQIERDVQATPADISPPITATGGSAPTGAKIAIRAFGVSKTSNASGFIDVPWPALDGVSAVLLTLTSLNSGNRTGQLVPNTINPSGMSVTLLNGSGSGTLNSTAVTFSVLVVGWTFDD